MDKKFKILVAVDFFKESLEAFHWAAPLARRIGAEMVLLAVAEWPDRGPAEGRTFVDFYGADEGFQAILMERLKDLASSADLDGVPSEALVRAGDPPEEILRAAKEEKADLIVMGTHGRRGVVRALMGSVAETVLRCAPCPVATVRPGRIAGVPSVPARQEKPAPMIRAARPVSAGD